MELVRPNAGQVRAVAGALRESDRAELGALHAGLEPGAALAACVGASARAWAMLQDGRAVALTGVCLNADGSGAPWLAGTGAVKDNPAAFMRASRRAVAGYREMFPRLENYVLASAKENVRYVRALGFKLGELRDIGGGRFYRFYM